MRVTNTSVYGLADSICAAGYGMNCPLFEPVEVWSLDFSFNQKRKNCGTCQNWDDNKSKCKLEHLLISRKI